MQLPYSLRSLGRTAAAEGATVIVTGSNPKTLEQTRAALASIEVIASDASDVTAIRLLIAEIARKPGRIDVLFANAGLGQYRPLAQSCEAFYDSMSGPSSSRQDRSHLYGMVSMVRGP